MSTKLSARNKKVLQALSDGKPHNMNDPVLQKFSEDCAVEDCVDSGLAYARKEEVRGGGMITIYYKDVRITKLGEQALATGRY